MRFYKLKFHSALHVDSRGSGEPEVAEDFIRSDTLSAALAIGWSSIFPEDRPEIFFNPPFKVSSAFPFIGETLLFPVPAWRIWNETDESKRKELKKVRYVSQSIFRQVLEGNEIDFKSVVLPSPSVAIDHDDILSCPELKNSPFWVMTERQRVMVDRLGMQSNAGPFFFALQFFSSDSGLWFAADAPPEILPKLRSTIDYMGDTGIGADRNSGLGHFQVTPEKTFPFTSDSGKNGWITLSLFNPDRMENLENLTHHAAYGLTTRSGWISNSTVGRLPVRAFTEGSYFSQKPTGRIVETLDKKIITDHDLPISHNAPRDFRAVSLPCAMPPCLQEGEQQ